MLRFASKPDPVFQSIVTVSIEYNIEDMEEEPKLYPDEDIDTLSYCGRLNDCFLREELIGYAKELLAAHKSDKLFQINDYHFLALYEFLGYAIDMHNERIEDGKEGLFVDPPVGMVDFDAIVDGYFWDVDFFLEAELYDSLNPVEKGHAMFDDVLFGLVHHLKPHPQEMIPKETEPWDDAYEQDFVFVPGSPYPDMSDPYEEDTDDT